MDRPQNNESDQTARPNRDQPDDEEHSGSSQDRPDWVETLSALRARLKELGGRETLSDAEWRAGASSAQQGRGTTRTGYPSADASEQDPSGQGAAGPRDSTAAQRVLDPVVDVFDEEDGIVVVAEMPGVAEEDIRVSVTDGVLSLTGARTDGVRFEKRIRLPEGVDLGSLGTTYRNGLLECRLAKLDGTASARDAEEEDTG